MAKVTIDAERCKGCELCIGVCPKNVLGMADGINNQGYHFAEMKGTDCIGCVFCARICPEVAIEVYK
ncbi:MAG TPA: tungsten formylmethanofuran dehydrogenase [Firmicutes bacterium]|nr:tungsten formylmethanofuran dehydrogenase [Bacillota bacterium]